MSSELSLVLVVDDEAPIREVASRALVGRARVLAVPSAELAMEVLKKDPGIQLIITDIRMPGGESGVVLHVNATAGKPPMYAGRWLVMTGGASEEELGYFLSLKPEPPQILSKPFEIPAFQRAVADVLRGS